MTFRTTGKASHYYHYALLVIRDDDTNEAAQLFFSAPLILSRFLLFFSGLKRKKNPGLTQRERMREISWKRDSRVNFRGRMDWRGLKGKRGGRRDSTSMPRCSLSHTHTKVKTARLLAFRETQRSNHSPHQKRMKDTPQQVQLRQQVEYYTSSEQRAANNGRETRYRDGIIGICRWSKQADKD